MKRSRKLWLVALSLLVGMGIFVGNVEATDGLRGDECVVAGGEVILEDFYFVCNTLVIYGFIDGDVIGVASEVKIAREGQVTGDIWMAGGQLTIEGVVGDDVHFLGIDLDITGLARFPNPRTDIIVGGVSLETSINTLIPGDVNFYGYQAILKGIVNGNVDFQGQSLVIQNTVGGNVDAIVGDPEGNAPLSSFPLLYSVNFREPGLYFTYGGMSAVGFVNGDLSYQAPQRVSTLDHVGGRVRYKQAIQQANITAAEQSDTALQIIGNYILETARDVAALSLVGILMLNFFAKLIAEPGYRVQKRPVSAFSWGLVIFLLSIPTALLVLLASLLLLLVLFVIALSEIEVTILVASILTVINLGYFGVFFFLFAFLGRAITCFIVGYLALRWIKRTWLRYYDTPPQILNELWFAVMIGVMIVSLVVNMPLGAFIGRIQFLLTGVVACTGLGALFMYLRDLWYLTGRIPLTRRGALRFVPPPPEDSDFDLQLPLGMDNLPEGFRGFED